MNGRPIRKVEDLENEGSEEIFKVFDEEEEDADNVFAVSGGKGSGKGPSKVIKNAYL